MEHRRIGIELGFRLRNLEMEFVKRNEVGSFNSEERETVRLGGSGNRGRTYNIYVIF